MSSQMNMQEGLNHIHEVFVKNVIEYLDTGIFKNKNNKSYVEAYSCVVQLADQDDNGDEIYKFYGKIVRDYTVDKVLNELKKKRETDLLNTLIKRWNNHQILVYWMQKVFCYLDRYYVRNRQEQALFQYGLEIFKMEVYEKIKNIISEAVIGQIQKERDKQPVDRDMLRQVLLCVTQMGLHNCEIQKIKEQQGERLVWKGEINYDSYCTDFEKKFLDTSKMHYKKLSADWLSKLGCPEYLQAVKEALDEEENRADKVLDSTTKPKLLALVEEELIKNHAQTLADMQQTGCQSMFQHSRLDQLKLMFVIFKRVPDTLTRITEKMGPYIEQRGEVIVKDQNLQQDAIEFTKKLLELKSEMDHIVSYSFSEHAQFQRCRDMSFQQFMNQCHLSAPYIASYCDNEMRKGLKGANEHETDQKLEAIIKLFVCLHERDVFFNSYTRFLSVRLLNQLSVSDEAEQMMIAKLKVECGHNIVANITNMFNDIALSRSLMDDFKQQVHHGSPNGVSLNVQVLRTGCWPENTEELCKIPKELLGCADSFKAFYNNKHTGRQLYWLMQHGQAELKVCYGQKAYTLVVSSFQAAILLQFNIHKELTLTQLEELTRIEDSNLRHQLMYLFGPKVVILNKQSKGPKVTENEPITVNLDLKSQSVRLDQRPPIKKEKLSGQQPEIDPKVLQQRKLILNAMIVRIMKSRRTIKHPELVAEVIHQVIHFKPQPQMIKQQIESLIQQEYIKRDENDRATYIYIP